MTDRPHGVAHEKRRVRLRLVGRGSITAGGAYLAAVLGFLTTVVATRELGLHDYARFAAVIAATTFFQQLLDLTIEEALVKYGFRYTESGNYGRLRRLFRVALAFKLLGGIVAGLALIALAPFARDLWGAGGVFLPMLIAATIAPIQAAENIAAGAILLRGRYDIRGAFMAVQMALRLIGLAIGCRYGVIGGVIGMAAAQLAATAAIGIAGLSAFKRFPRADPEPLGEDAVGVRKFLVSSSLSSALDSARRNLAASLIPTVAAIEQTAFFRNAQAPATAFDVLSGPIRLVMLTEQTRDFEAGRHVRVFAMLRRYIMGALTVMVVAVPVLWLLMPYLIGLAYGHDYRVHASTAARIMLLAAALRVIWGWTKSFPVSIGRPGLRVVVQTVEIAVLVPSLLFFTHRWGATGAAAAMLLATVVFCIAWTVVLIRLRGDFGSVRSVDA